MAIHTAAHTATRAATCTATRTATRTATCTATRTATHTATRTAKRKMYRLGLFTSGDDSLYCTRCLSLLQGQLALLQATTLSTPKDDSLYYTSRHTSRLSSLLEKIRLLKPRP